MADWKAKSKIIENDKIIKAKIDKRTYKAIQLPNALKVLLIQDKEAINSAASINIGAGVLLDEKQFPGTAHYLEHMLFMGSKKYPGEYSWSDFIKQNGGYNNAYCDDEDTNYYYDVGNQAFEESLDRFSQFFINPNFSKHA